MKAPFAKFVSGFSLFTLLCAIPSTTEAVYAGTKSMGRAGAVMAKPLDALVIAYNPAGLAWVDEQLNVGGTWIRQDGRARFSGNTLVQGGYQSHERASTFLPDVGACMHYYQCNWTVGVAAYTRDFVKTNYGRAFPQFGTTKLGLEYEHETVSPAFAVKFGRYHSFGVSLDLMAHRLKVNGLENLAVFSERPNKFTNEGYDYAFGVGCTVGILSEIWDCTHVALAWSPAISMENFRKYKGLLAEKGQLHFADRYMAGISIDLFDNFTFELDGEHAGWNHIPALHHRIERLLEDGEEFGSEDGPGLGWMDQMIWRMGIEYVYNESISLRAGYQHSRSPIHGSQTLLNMLTPNVIEDWITAGLTWNTCRLGELSIYTGYGFNKNIQGKDSIDPVFGGGEVDIEDRQLNVSLTWSKYY
jgi:long-chain fatty acid transport protein